MPRWNSRVWMTTPACWSRVSTNHEAWENSAAFPWMPVMAEGFQ
jgi:hypothetical protein